MFFNTTLFINAVLDAQKTLSAHGSKDNVLIVKYKEAKPIEPIGAIYGMNVYASSSLPDDTDFIVMSHEEMERLNG